MIAMNITVKSLKEIIDCLDYAIDQMETSCIAVTSDLSSDDSEERFDAVAYCLNRTKIGLEAIAEANEGIIIVEN